MTKFYVAGKIHKSTMLVSVNLGTYGWVTLNIPLQNRTKVLEALDVELKSYRTSPQWRKILGDRVVAWLNYIVNPSN